MPPAPIPDDEPSRPASLSVLDAVPVGILRLEPVRDHRTRLIDFRIEEVNPAGARTLRRSTETLTGSMLCEQLPAMRDAGVFALLERVQAMGDSDTIDCRYADARVSASLRCRAVRLGSGVLLTIEDITEAVAYERELEARDRLLRQFVENTPAAVAMFDTQMRYLVVADRWREAYGLGDAELEGRSHYEVFPEIGEEWKAMHRRTLAGETIRCERDRFERADGRVQYLRYQLQPWQTASGEVGGMVMFTEDITDRVSSELELESRREIIEVAGELSRVGGWSFDVESGRLSWTDQTRRIFGVPAGYQPDVVEAIGFYEDDAVGSISEVFGRALETGEPYDIELAIRTVQGERRLTRSIGKPIVRDGRVVRISGSIQDVTDELRAKHEMLRDKDVLEQAERVSGVGGWAYDLEQNELYWTPEVYKIHGVEPWRVPTPEDAIAFYTDASRPRIERAFYASIERGEPFDLELEIRRADGRVVPVRSMGQPIMRDGRVVRIAGSFQDLTEIRSRADEERRLTGLLTAITDASNDVIFVKDTEGRVLFGNPAYAAALGTNVDELIGTCDQDWFGEGETRELLARSDRRVLEGGVPVVAEENVVLPSTGEERCFLAEKHPYRLADGSIGGVIGVCRDVTEYRRALDTIAQSQQSLNFALDAANVGFWDHDLRTDRVTYSDSWYTMLGYEAQEFPASVELFWEDLLDPRDHDRVRAAHGRYLRGESGVYAEEIRLQAKNGSTRWVLDIGRVIERDEQGAPLRMVGVHIDIDERRRNHDRLQTALTSARSGLWEWDLTDNSCYFDERWYTLLGYRKGELPMAFQTWESLCHPDDLGPAKEALGSFLAGSSDRYSFEHRLWTKAGEWKWVLGSAEITSRDSEGRPLRVVGVNIDFDERHRAAEELAAALVEAEHASRAKSQFLANMSHEIRTPMTAILGYTELMLTESPLDATQREMVATIYRNGQHLLSLINDILDLSKIEAGKMTIERIEFQPADMLLGVRSLMAERAAAKGIGFGLDPASTIPDHLRGDPVRLRQIVVNLVGNAIKFTERGSVTVRTGPASGGGALEVSIADTGVGMTPEQARQLFTPFQQADESMTRRFGGTGLGLSISKRLAELLGGAITVESELGVGSTFTLRIPIEDPGGVTWSPIRDVSDDSARLPAPKPARPEGPGKLVGVSVLVAEDGRDNQRLIAYNLRRAGAEVTIVGNGRLALEALQSGYDMGGQFDIVLMDMQMPEMDGYTATREIRRRGIAVPVVALTAHAMDGDRDKCLRAGCDEYITKPIDRASLIATIAAWVHGSGSDSGRADAA